MDFNNFQNLCKDKVVDYFNERVEKTDNTKITGPTRLWTCATKKRKSLHTQKKKKEKEKKPKRNLVYHDIIIIK